MYYLDFLSEVHLRLLPRRYAEIGVFRGASLSAVLPLTRAVGIDPAARVSEAVPRRCTIYEQTSDDYFATRSLVDDLGGRLDVGFIDGMHLFEFALRDCRHLEPASHSGSAVLLDDCYPKTQQMTSREATSGPWTGDVWKVFVALRRFRPECRTFLVDTPPTGTGLVVGLDASSRVLVERFDEVVGELEGMAFDPDELARELERSRQPTHCAGSRPGTRSRRDRS